jgi:hypothetical protein
MDSGAGWRNPKARMNTNDRGKVKNVTTLAADAPLRNSASGRKACFSQTKATNMIIGTGVCWPLAHKPVA